MWCNEGLTSDTLASLKGRQLTTTVRRPPTLLLNIHEAYWLRWRPGLLGMAVAGEHFVRENAIVDPAFQIARELGDGFGQSYGLRPSPPVLVALDDDPTKINQPIPAADLLLDVWTDDWSLEPRPSSASKTSDLRSYRPPRSRKQGPREPILIVIMVGRLRWGGWIESCRRRPGRSATRSWRR